MRGWLERRRLRRRAWELVRGIPLGYSFEDRIGEGRFSDSTAWWLFEIFELDAWMAGGCWRRSPRERRNRTGLIRDIDDIVLRWPAEIDDPDLRAALDELRTTIARYDELLR